MRRLLAVLFFSALCLTAQAAPSKGLAKDVVDHLDVTTIPSSIGPRKEKGKTSFKDYGFEPLTISETEALLVEGSPKVSWTFQIRVLDHTADTVTICLHDKAENGGSYDTQSCLVLKRVKRGLIFAKTLPKDQRCLQFAKEGPTLEQIQELLKQRHK